MHSLTSELLSRKCQSFKSVSDIYQYLSSLKEVFKQENYVAAYFNDDTESEIKKNIEKS